MPLQPIINVGGTGHDFQINLPSNNGGGRHGSRNPSRRSSQHRQMRIGNASLIRDHIALSQEFCTALSQLEQSCSDARLDFDKIHELQKEICHYEQELKEVSLAKGNAVDAMRAAVADKSTAVAATNAANLAKDAAVTAMNAANLAKDTAEAEKDAAVTAMNTAKFAKSAAEAERDAAKLAKNMVVAEMNALKAEMNGLSNRNLSLLLALQSSNDNIAIYRKGSETLQEEVLKLSAALWEKNQVIGDQKEAIDRNLQEMQRFSSVKSDYEKLQTQLSKKASEVAELKARLSSEREEEKAKNESKIAQLEAQLSSEREDNANTIQDQADAITRNDQEMQRLKSTANMLEEQLKALQPHLTQPEEDSVADDISSFFAGEDNEDNGFSIDGKAKEDSTAADEAKEDTTAADEDEQEDGIAAGEDEQEDVVAASLEAQQSSARDEKTKMASKIAELQAQLDFIRGRLGESENENRRLLQDAIALGEITNQKEEEINRLSKQLGKVIALNSSDVSRKIAETRRTAKARENEALDVLAPVVMGGLTKSVHKSSKKTKKSSGSAKKKGKASGAKKQSGSKVGGASESRKKAKKSGASESSKKRKKRGSDESDEVENGRKKKSKASTEKPTEVENGRKKKSKASTEKPTEEAMPPLPDLTLGQEHEALMTMPLEDLEAMVHDGDGGATPGLSAGIEPAASSGSTGSPGRSGINTAASHEEMMRKSGATSSKMPKGDPTQELVIPEGEMGTESQPSVTTDTNEESPTGRAHGTGKNFKEMEERKREEDEEKERKKAFAAAKKQDAMTGQLRRSSRTQSSNQSTCSSLGVAEKKYVGELVAVPFIENGKSRLFGGKVIDYDPASGCWTVRFDDETEVEYFEEEEIRDYMNKAAAV